MAAKWLEIFVARDLEKAVEERTELGFVPMSACLLYQYRTR
jgi:hypothetical protein